MTTRLEQYGTGSGIAFGAGVGGRAGALAGVVLSLMLGASVVAVGGREEPEVDDTTTPPEGSTGST